MTLSDGASFVTHRFQAKFAPPIPIPAKTEPSKTPIKLSQLLENLNIQLLKRKFAHQSKIEIKNYLIDLNSREIFLNNTKLKLTEKEINTIIYLSNKKTPVSIHELQTKVWGYQSGMETHTVETHIYRLRKKILKSFNDESLILSKKNGYQIS